MTAKQKPLKNPPARKPDPKAPEAKADAKSAVKPAETKPLTHIEVRAIAPLASREAYSRFVLKSLLEHVETPHVLLIQWDGYVVNPAAFEPAFLECDYIGAKWFWFNDGMRVGNGGFSLRSRKLLAALQDARIQLGDAEDTTIARTFRPLLERAVLDNIVPGGVFLLNTPYRPNEVWDHLPARVQQAIFDKNLQFYVIDAYKVARESGSQQCGVECDD